MKLGYIVALLVIVLMVGCAAPPVAEPTAPAEEAAPATPPAEEAAPPAEEAAPPAEEAAETGLSDADLANIERLKGPCERGNAGLCAALKSQYNIDWPPAVVEEPEASDEPVEPTE